MKKIFLIALMASGLMGCFYDKSEELYPPPNFCDSTNVTYSNHLKPIMENQCALSGCHLTQFPSGWDLSSYEGLKTVAENGRLLPAIMHSGSSPQMPKGLQKLDDCTIAKFVNWVNNNVPQ